jgi:hypothetical protein
MGADFDHGKTSRLHPAHLFPERKKREATTVSFEIEDFAHGRGNTPLKSSLPRRPCA